MTRRRPTWQLLLGAVVLAAAGICFGRYVVPSSATPPAPSLDTLPRVYSFGCAGEAPPTIDPTSIPVACADGSAVLTHLSWSSWTRASAAGSGVLELNNCTPSCAAGVFSPYASRVTLGDPVASRTQGDVFAVMTVRADDGKGGTPKVTRVQVYSRRCNLTDC